MRPLHGKTALVTHASHGIGRASALALAHAGAQVLVHAFGDERAAHDVVNTIAKAGGHAQTVSADLRAADGPHKLARRVGVVIGARLDILVASAGASTGADLDHTRVDDFDELFAVNVRAPFFLVQQLMPAMCKGSSVVLASAPIRDASKASSPSTGEWSAYAVTNGAIGTLVRHLALTLGPRGVRLNAIALDASVSASRHSVPVEDVGAIVAFLASDAARWITGETLHIKSQIRF